MRTFLAPCRGRHGGRSPACGCAARIPPASRCPRLGSAAADDEPPVRATPPPLPRTMMPPPPTPLPTTTTPPRRRRTTGTAARATADRGDGEHRRQSAAVARHGGPLDPPRLGPPRGRPFRHAVAIRRVRFTMLRSVLPFSITTAVCESGESREVGQPIGARPPAPAPVVRRNIFDTAHTPTRDQAPPFPHPLEVCTHLPTHHACLSELNCGGGGAAGRRGSPGWDKERWWEGAMKRWEAAVEARSYLRRPQCRRLPCSCAARRARRT